MRRAEKKSKIFIFLVAVFITLGCAPTIKETKISQGTYEIIVKPGPNTDLCKIFHERSMAICGGIYEPVNYGYDRDFLGGILAMRGVIKCYSRGAWWKDDMTNIKRDRYECKYDAELLSGFSQSKGFCDIMVKGNRMVKLLFECLESKGYVFRETNP